MCSLTGKTRLKESIGHPKITNNQQGKCVKIQFLGENKNRVSSVFMQYLKIYKSNLAVILHKCG